MFSTRNFRTACLALVAVIGITPFVASTAHGADDTDINAKASINKALRYVDEAHNMASTSFLPSKILIDRAYEIAPGDTDIQLAYNDYDLILNQWNNPTYYTQLDLIRQAHSPAYQYYETLFNTTPPNADTDTLYAFRTALQAYRQFPAEEVFGLNVLNEALKTVTIWCYDDDDEVDMRDTLSLSIAQKEFIDTVYSLADEIERRVGYHIIVDRTRAFLNMTTKDNDAMQKFVTSLENRDDPDTETLNILATTYEYLQDTTKSYEIVNRMFAAEPVPEILNRLISVSLNDTLMQSTIDTAYRFISDTDNDSDDRLWMISQLTLGYLSGLEDVPMEEPNLILFNNTMGEIIAEQPNEPIKYARSALLDGNFPQWTNYYGYTHWIDMLHAVPDSTEQILGLTARAGEMLPANDLLNEAYEGLIARLQAEGNPDNITMEWAYLQYLYNSHQYSKVIELIEDMSFDKMMNAAVDIERSYFDDIARGKAREPEMTQEELSDAIAEQKEPLGAFNPLKKWIIMQNLLSQSYSHLGDTLGAIIPLQRIALVEPADPENLNNLAYYMGETGTDLPQALKLVNRSLHYNPDNAHALDTRAWILYKMGDYEAALADMRHILQMAGQNVLENVMMDNVQLPSYDIFELLGMEDQYFTAVLAVYACYNTNTHVFLEHLIEIMSQFGDRYATEIRSTIAGLDLIDRKSNIADKYRENYE